MKQLRLIISRPDRLGDVVLSTFLPREIKRFYPESYICLLVRKYTKAIYLNNPFVDKIIVMDEYEFTDKLFRVIRGNKFTHSIMLLPTEKVNWLFFLAGIRNRIGVGDKFYQFITNTKSIYRRKYVPLKHEADYCADSIRKLGIYPQSLIPEIYFTEEEKEEIMIIKRNNYPKEFLWVGINSTSGGSAPNLAPLEYRKIVQALKLIKGIKPVIIDLMPPKELLDIEGESYPHINLSLRDSLKHITALDLVISSSTGPMHIAAALKVKTLSVFCPITVCSPKLWGPLGNDAKVLLPEPGYCSALCKEDPKRCNFSGKGGIDAEMVVKSVKEILLN